MAIVNEVPNASLFQPGPSRLCLDNGGHRETGTIALSRDKLRSHLSAEVRNMLSSVITESSFMDRLPSGNWEELESKYGIKFVVPPDWTLSQIQAVVQKKVVPRSDGGTPKTAGKEELDMVMKMIEQKQFYIEKVTSSR